MPKFLLFCFMVLLVPYWKLFPDMIVQFSCQMISRHFNQGKSYACVCKTPVLDFQGYVAAKKACSSPRTLLCGKENTTVSFFLSMLLTQSYTCCKSHLILPTWNYSNFDQYTLLAEIVLLLQNTKAERTVTSKYETSMCCLYFFCNIVEPKLNLKTFSKQYIHSVPVKDDSFLYCGRGQTFIPFSQEPQLWLGWNSESAKLRSICSTTQCNSWKIVFAVLVLNFLPPCNKKAWQGKHFNDKNSGIVQIYLANLILAKISCSQPQGVVTCQRERVYVRISIGLLVVTRGKSQCQECCCNRAKTEIPSMSFTCSRRSSAPFPLMNADYHVAVSYPFCTRPLLW